MQTWPQKYVYPPRLENDASSEQAYEADMDLGLAETERLVVALAYGIGKVDDARLGLEGNARAKAKVGVAGRHPISIVLRPSIIAEREQVGIESDEIPVLRRANGERFSTPGGPHDDDDAVSLDPRDDLLARRVRVLLQKVHRRHDLPRLAIAALRHAFEIGRAHV